MNALLLIQSDDSFESGPSLTNEQGLNHLTWCVVVFMSVSEVKSCGSVIYSLGVKEKL